MTAEQLITRAFSKLGIRNSSTPITDAEMSDAILELNDFMRQMEADGIVIGWTPVRTKTDEITTPDWTWRMIYLNFAIILAPEYGKEPSQILYADARGAYSTVLDQIIDPIRTAYPSDLPVGAGNMGVGPRMGNSVFFGNDFEDDILTGGGSAAQNETGDTLKTN